MTDDGIETVVTVELTEPQLMNIYDLLHLDLEKLDTYVNDYLEDKEWDKWNHAVLNHGKVTQTLYKITDAIDEIRGNKN